MLCYSRGVLPVASALGAAQLWVLCYPGSAAELAAADGAAPGEGSAARVGPRTHCRRFVRTSARGAAGRAALICCPQGAGSARARSDRVTVFRLLAGRQPVTTERWRAGRGLLKKVTLAPGTPAPRRPRKNAPEDLRARRRDTPAAPAL